MDRFCRVDVIRPDVVLVKVFLEEMSDALCDLRSGVLALVPGRVALEDAGQHLFPFFSAFEVFVPPVCAACVLFHELGGNSNISTYSKTIKMARRVSVASVRGCVSVWDERTNLSERRRSDWDLASAGL